MPQDGYGNPTGGMPSAFGLGGGYGYMNPAMLTPQQRMNMYAMQLMSGGSSQPQRSGWGAASNAFSPMLGAAMMNWGGGQNQGGGGTGGWAGANSPQTLQSLYGMGAGGGSGGWMGGGYGGSPV